MQKRSNSIQNWAGVRGAGNMASPQAGTSSIKEKSTSPDKACHRYSLQRQIHCILRCLVLRTCFKKRKWQQKKKRCRRRKKDNLRFITTSKLCCKMWIWSCCIRLNLILASSTFVLLKSPCFIILLPIHVFLHLFVIKLQGLVATYKDWLFWIKSQDIYICRETMDY